ncbi:MAG: glycosyltransferase [Pseudomonadota bacterium]
MFSIAWVIAYVLFPFLGSLAIASLIVRYQYLHCGATADCDLTGIQKFHVEPVPRIGGIPIVCALGAGFLLLKLGTTNQSVMLLESYALLIIAASFAFAIGLLEDLTKKIGPLPRLLVTFLAAAYASDCLGVKIDRMDIPFIDDFLRNNPLAITLLTVFVIGGVSHAFNIIDGYNGLASGASLIMCIALSLVACFFGDWIIAVPCFILIGGILGFLVLNFPYGKLFLGDGGAYLIGFMLSSLAILLGNRHSESISPWFPMLLVIYPVFETVFSMCRRKAQGRAMGLPDRGHLHQLIFLRLVRWKTTSKANHDKIFRNSLTSPYLWGLTSAAVIPAVLFYSSTRALSFFIILFMVSYMWLYRRIVHFKTPKWLVFSIPDHKPLDAQCNEVK